MVNAQLARRALEDAEEWVQSARKLAEINAGPKILYSLEMGIELSLKALLLYHSVDFPKIHNILEVVVNLITSDKFNDTEIKENSELIFTTFHGLLNLRGASGYSYESSYDRQFFAEKVQQYEGPVEKILEMVKRHMLSGEN